MTSQKKIKGTGKKKKKLINRKGGERKSLLHFWARLFNLIFYSPRSFSQGLILFHIFNQMVLNATLSTPL